MTTIGVLPNRDYEQDPYNHQYLTFVVPAPNGCNLKCAFCLVKQRREITGNYLRPIDMARFVHEAAERTPIFALSIQGYEPLLPESLPYTRTLLATGALLRLPTTLVTNGVFLTEAMELLTVLAPTKIAISLDSASANVHDRVRGVRGAWAATVDGIRRAVDILRPRTRLAVSSVLLKSKYQNLEGMPALLRDLGIDRWIVNPLLRVGRGKAGGPVGDLRILFRQLLLLKNAADRVGVDLTVDDEFNRFAHDATGAEWVGLRSLHVRTLPRGVKIFRLAPNGQCSFGEDILKRVTPEVPRWTPGIMHAGDFLSKLVQSSPSYHVKSSGAPRRATKSET
jgi:MoaA/NifB/PqqE/SkfB family radical SAM enzyme